MACSRLFVLVAATATLAAPSVFAGQRHHHTHRSGSLNYYDGAYTDSYGGSWEGEAIARATRRMQFAPGVTNELDPTAKATATGGPVGGVPGFSGH